MHMLESFYDQIVLVFIVEKKFNGDHEKKTRQLSTSYKGAWIKIIKMKYLRKEVATTTSRVDMSIGGLKSKENTILVQETCRKANNGYYTLKIYLCDCHVVLLLLSGSVQENPVSRHMEWNWNKFNKFLHLYGSARERIICYSLSVDKDGMHMLECQIFPYPSSFLIS